MFTSKTIVKRLISDTSWVMASITLAIGFFSSLSQQTCDFSCHLRLVLGNTCIRPKFGLILFKLGAFLIACIGTIFDDPLLSSLM